MKLLHFPWLRRLLGRGVNSDIRPELLPDGFAHEAINIRPESISGDTGAITAIGGEELASFEQQAQDSDWSCIGSSQCLEYFVEFWATSTEALVKINGQIVAQSPNIPYRNDRPLQLAVVDDVRRGVIYPADHASDPLYWDVQELLDNVGTPLYFSSYTTNINSVLLTSNPEFPVHTGNIEVSPGLPVGQYQYRLRYITPLGDRSNPGPETPLITVPLWQDRKLTWQQGVFPGLSTVGGPVSPDQQTGYGIQLQFRIDNQQGYSDVEILRRRFNTGDGKSIEEVVGRIEIQPGQVSVQTFVDPADAIATPEVIPDDESEQRLLIFTKPKTVEYADRRIQYGNIEVGSRDPGITFIENSDGERMVPITQGVYTQPDQDPNSIYNDGYSDPVNNTYLKTFVRGEKYGIGVMVWDRFSAKYYVSEVYDSFQFPNRRDPKRGDSATLSDNPIWAATTNCDNAGGVRVEQTFDAFTQGNKSKFPLPAANTGYNRINMAIGQGDYNPWGPVNPVDSGLNFINDQTRVGMAPHTQVNAGAAQIGSASSYLDATQFIWSPQYQALGGALYGVENIPRGAKVMSIMRTEPANRVIAQGIGAYYIVPSTDPSDPTTPRSRFVLNCHFPDFSSFKVDQATQDDIISNPQNYRIQFVSPLGVTSEPYGWLGSNTGSSDYAAPLADILTYAGIQYDQGQVNNGEPLTGMAYQADGGSPAPISNYVGYKAWRGQVPASGTGPFHNTPEQGNKLIEISNVTEVTSGRSAYLRIQLAEQLYSLEDVPNTSSFGSSDTRAYHEPFYVINIVRADAEVSDLTIDRYINTGHHVKLESCIGVSTGLPAEFPLLNERWEDVISTDPTQIRYVWVQDGANEPVAWLQINGSVFAPFAQQILLDIAQDGYWISPDGTFVGGLCVANIGTAPSSGWRNSSCVVSFGSYGTIQLTIPPAGSRILVRYNKNAPIKFFGGDATIAPSLACFADTYADVNTSGGITGLGTSLTSVPRLPYAGYRKNPGYYLPITSSVMASDFAAQLTSIRQWCVLWDAEHRSASRYAIGTTSLGGPYQWPKIGYIIKPYGYDSNDPQNGMHAYPLVNIGGTDVSLTLEYSKGGILFQDSYNPDYWKQSEVDGFGIPFDDQGGIIEKTVYPTGVVCSLEVNPLLTDVPGIRTFIDTNLKVLSEENGEIKAMGTALAEGSRNLYAFCERGVARILTQKEILTGASGEVLSTQLISNYYGPEMWLSRAIGMPDQMWRLLVKANAAAGSTFADSFFWGDRNGMYRLTGNTIQNITLNRFISDALPLLRSYPSGYQSAAVRSSSGYNRNYDEVMFSFAQGEGPSRVLVFDASLGEWIGEFSYQFDSYAMYNGLLYGSRELQTFLLDTGDTISGTTRVASVVIPFVGDLGNFKEFCRWRIMGTVAEAKPDQIEILNENYDVIVRKDATINGSPYWTKYYDGWEGWADRVLASFDPARPLPQSSMFYLRLIWNTPGRKAAIGASAQLKNIK
jgi:hypothetical protein